MIRRLEVDVIHADRAIIDRMCRSLVASDAAFAEASKILARASGRTLGELSYASVDTFENQRPMPHMARAMAANMNAAPAPTEEFTPQTVTVTAHVNVLFNLK